MVSSGCSALTLCTHSWVAQLWWEGGGGGMDQILCWTDLGDLRLPWWLSVKNLPVMQETWVLSLGQEDPLEKGMAIHSRMLPAEFHGQRSLVGYSPWGHRVGHSWVINTTTCPPRQSSHSRWSNSILESEPETNASRQARSPAFDLQRALFGSERCLETTQITHRNVRNSHVFRYPLTQILC